MTRFCCLFVLMWTLLFPCQGENVERHIFYVSLKGDNGNEGSLKRPFKTLQMALDRVGELNGKDTVEIVLRGGCYELDKTVELCGKNNLVIRSYENEEVILSGGKAISQKALKKISDASVWNRLQPLVRKQVREVDFEELGFPLNGLHASGFGRPSRSAWTQLFINDEAAALSRWPNDSTVLIGKILRSGVGPKGEGEPYPAFCYSESRPSTWKDVSQMWISGYFAHGYADDMIQVERIDTVNKAVYAAQHTVYGFMTGAPWRRWFALNLLEEIDLPGEYVIDMLRKKIYLYPPIGKINTIHASLLEGPVMAIENAKNVTVRNITFKYGRQMGVYMENTENVRIQGCTITNVGGVGVAIGKGTVTLGKAGVRPHSAEAGGVATSREIGDLQGRVYQDILFNRQGGRNNGIVDCHIYNVGAGGVSLGGGDRASLTPAGNFVENCDIHDYNQVEKSYRPGVWIDGVGNRVTKCNIYNAPSMAILFHGNDHLIELCKITNVCTEVDDQGAVYYGRDASEQGNVIRYCYFKELSPRHRVTATYHDDGACGAEVYGNIYYKAGSLPVLIGGGHDNHYKHNIFIESPVAIHLDNRMQNWGKFMIKRGGIIDQRLKEVNYRESPYREAYPQLVHYWDKDASYPSGNVIEGNLFYKIGNVVNGRTEWGEFRNNWVTNTNPGFIDEQNPLKGFKADAAVFQYIKDFPNLPFEQIGCDLLTEMEE